MFISVKCVNTMAFFIYFFFFIVAFQHSNASIKNENASSSAMLRVESIDQQEENGVIVKKVNESLVLKCSLVDSNMSVIENAVYQWVLPSQDINRSKNISSDNSSSELVIEFLQSNDTGQYACVVSNLKANVYIAVHPSSISYCSSSMFLCDDGKRCISKNYMCDGRSDCPSGKDETYETCGTNDPCIDKLRCGDGRCIPKNWCCFGSGCTFSIQHPCCFEKMEDGFPYDRTGGELKKDTASYVLMKDTIYRATACIFVVFLTLLIIVSAICRARLKRISNRCGFRSIQLLEQNRPTCDSTSPVRNCQYSLICDVDIDNVDSLNLSRPPSYSEINQTLPQSNSQTPNLTNTLPVLTQVQNSNSRDSESIQTNNNTPARRPNDFGMGFLTNTIFNSRYRPVHRQNNENTSLDYITDSDSSCRSSAIYSNNLNMGTLEFNSHFYGERIGGTPEISIFGRLSDNRRLRQAALDRILDRFGLNAPYNIVIDREIDNYITSNYREQTPRQRQFFSSIWTRIKNRFGRNYTNERQNRNSVIQENYISVQNNNTNHRRRPDTPDVLESILDDYLMPMRYLQRREVYTPRESNLNNRNNFPPPYSRFAPDDPPPPYISRENLISSRINVCNNNNNNEQSLNELSYHLEDQNGNLLVENSIIDYNLDSSVNNNINCINNISSENETDNITVMNSDVAFDICDDNGNLNQTLSTNSNIANNSLNTFITCAKCTEITKCNKHTNFTNIKFINTTIDEDDEILSLTVESSSPVNTDFQIPSTSFMINNSTFSVINNNIICNDNEQFVNTSTVENNLNKTSLYKCSMDESSENSTSSKMYTCNQDNVSVPCENMLESSTSILEDNTKSTDDCGLIFSSQNLEFIDSDSYLDQRIDT